MKNRKFSLKLAAWLLACGSFGFVLNFLKPDLVYAMEGGVEQNSPSNSPVNKPLDVSFDTLSNIPLKSYKYLFNTPLNNLFNIPFISFLGKDKTNEYMKQICEEKEKLFKSKEALYSTDSSGRDRYTMTSHYPLYPYPFNPEQISPIFSDGVECCNPGDYERYAIEYGEFPVENMHTAHFGYFGSASHFLEGVIGMARQFYFDEVLVNIENCISVVAECLRDMYRVKKQYNFSEEEVEQNRELVKAKEKELEEAKKQLVKLDENKKEKVSTSERNKKQTLIEQKAKELENAKAKLPEYLKFKDIVKESVSSEIEKETKDGIKKVEVVKSEDREIENSIIGKYGDRKLFDAVRQVLQTIKYFVDNVGKEYKKYLLERMEKLAKDLVKDSDDAVLVKQEQNLISLKDYDDSLEKEYKRFSGNDIEKEAEYKRFCKDIKAFAEVINVCWKKIKAFLKFCTTPSLYDLFTDFSDCEEAKLKPIEFRKKGLFKILFGEEFAEYCKNEMKKISKIEVNSYKDLIKDIDKGNFVDLFYEKASGKENKKENKMEYDPGKKIICISKKHKRLADGE